MPESRMRDSLFAMMVVGFGCICVIGTACSFPLILMGQSDQAGYRMFNLAQSPERHRFCALLCHSDHSRKQTFDGDDRRARLCPDGLRSARFRIGARGHRTHLPLFCRGSPAERVWLLPRSSGSGSLPSFQERKAILVLGYQVFFGSAIFIVIALLNRQITSELAIVACFISGFFAYASYNRITSQNESTFVRESFRSSMQIFHKQRVFARVLVIPIVGFHLDSIHVWDHRSRRHGSRRITLW